MKQILKFLFPYLKPYTKEAVIAVFLSLPLSAIKGLEIWLIKHLIDILAPGSSFQDAYMLAGALFLLGILNFPCRFYHFYLMRFVVDRATCDLRSQIYKKLQRIPLSFFTVNKSGTLVSNVMNDSIMLSQGFRGMVDLIREPVTAIIMLGMAFYMDWVLTLLFLVVGPLFVLIFAKSGKKIKHYQEQVQEMIARMTHNVSEGLHGQKIAKSFNLQNYVAQRFNQSQEDFFYQQMKATKIEELAHPLVELVGVLAFSGVILFAYYRIHYAQMELGNLISFVAALALVMDPIRKYSQANVKINQAIAAGQRLTQLMQLPEEVDQGTLSLPSFNHSIEFDHVTFAYPGRDENVLKNVSFSIRKGEKVGVVGGSGAGKSTLIYLLLRLYPLEKGEIRIDGTAIQQYTLAELRKIFGLVSQDMFVFHDTVLENMQVGHNYPPSAVELALATAGAKEFVEQLEHNVETVIGDRGTRLSGGQCQRLTIARAILQNPPVLLFDEATSALDHASEQVVQEALERWSGGKTVLAIAHRLSTLKSYDKIIVMSGGTIVEQGTHEQLLSREGEYARLYQLGQHNSSSTDN